MKKILVIHTKYRNLGGEEIAVDNEVNNLKNYFDVRTIYFSNETTSIYRDIKSLFTNSNKKSETKLKNRKLKNAVLSPLKYKANEYITNKQILVN